MTLEDFGWSQQRQDAYTAHAADGLVQARVVSEHWSHL